LRRSGQNLPFTPSTVIERGDVLSISRVQAEIARVAAEVGYLGLSVGVLLAGLVLRHLRSRDPRFGLEEQADGNVPTLGYGLAARWAT
jgi:hypothetical protein